MLFDRESEGIGMCGCLMEHGTCSELTEVKRTIIFNPMPCTHPHRQFPSFFHSFLCCLYISIRNAQAKQDEGYFGHFHDGGSVYKLGVVMKQAGAVTLSSRGVAAGVRHLVHPGKRVPSMRSASYKLIQHKITTQDDGKMID